MSFKRYIPIFLAIAALIAAFLLFGSIFTYLILAMVLSTILRPVQDFFEGLSFYQVRLPKALGVIFTLIVLVGIITSIGWLLIPLLYEQVDLISSLDFSEMADDLKTPLYNLEVFLIDNDLSDEEPGFIFAGITQSVKNFIIDLDLQTLINGLLSATGNFLVSIMSIMFITFFLLYENGLIKNLILRAVPNAYFELTVSTMFKIEKLLSNYLIGIFFQMAAVFSIISLGMTLIGTKYAFTIGLVCAITNLIPYIGPIIGDIFAIVVGLTTTSIDGGVNEYLIFTGKMGGVLLFAQLIDNTFLQPIIFSKSVKAHPLEIFLVVFAGGILGGPVGMIAAIPTYTVIRVMTVEFVKGYKQFTIFRI